MHKSLFRSIYVSLLMAAPAVACEATVEDIQTEIDCYGYCDTLASCDEDVDMEQCRNECEDQLENNCMDDELDEVQMQLDECSGQTCDNITACTVEAGAQCYLGI